MKQINRYIISQILSQERSLSNKNFTDALASIPIWAIDNFRLTYFHLRVEWISLFSNEWNVIKMRCLFYEKPTTMRSFNHFTLHSNLDKFWFTGLTKWDFFTWDTNTTKTLTIKERAKFILRDSTKY